jgi:plastocyanin
MNWMTLIARRLSLAVLSIALILGVFMTTAPASALADTQTVEMTTALKFAPATVTAKAGDTIVWNNAAGLPHNVVFEDASKFDKSKVDKLGQMLGKGSVELTLPADLPAGTYNYYCVPHRGAGMVGQIVVE